MKRLWLLLAMAVPLQPIYSQKGLLSIEVKHAPPTVEQCRADQTLWRSKLDQAPVPSGVKDVSFAELVNWYTEMKDCINLDPDHRTDYLVTLTSIDSTQMTRIINFLDRHHLTWDQFLAEDAQGKR